MQRNLYISTYKPTDRFPSSERDMFIDLKFENPFSKHLRLRFLAFEPKYKPLPLWGRPHNAEMAGPSGREERQASGGGIRSAS